MESILKIILEKTKKTPTLQAYNDLKDMCREALKTDVKLATKYLFDNPSRWYY